MTAVSIIIPVYNGEKTILRAVRSCLRQSYSDLEIIIIDNGSDDETANIVSNIHDKRVKFFQTEEKGRSLARNIGLRKSIGRYIQFLDADDILYEDKISDAMNFLSKNPSMIAFGSSVLYRKNSEIWTVNNFKKASRELLSHNLFPINAFVFKKDFTKFDESLEFDEDWLFWADLFHEKSHLIFSSEKIGGEVFITGNNTMKNTARMLYYEIFVRGIIKRKYPKISLFLFFADFKKMVTINLLFELNKIDRNQLEIVIKEFHFTSFLARLALKLPYLRSVFFRRVSDLLNKKDFE